MSTQIQDERNKWLRRYGPAPDAAPRLVCFPHAGGSASWFHPLSGALAPEVAVVAVQYPGRQDRRAEQPLQSVEELADRIAPLLAEPGGPLLFFGHSMGAAVAFEVARRLVEAGHPGPQHFFASGRRAPGRTRDETVHLMSDRGLLAEVVALGGTDPKSLGDEDLIAMVLPPMRADYRAIETYRCAPGEPLRCPVTVLTGDADPKTSLDEARAWNEYTSAVCDVQVFRGGHFFIVDHQAEIEDLVRDVAKQLVPIARST
ncbi:Surfactin synthase thioesterase subunit [Lentzea albida]|uniref:Surfactin synthase thioesterase subunit n=1 Tax=Lentzea albida TaxID=65499 RepID=A0A1H9X651_9PSEU|nr:Surfactin synthase thioesterase subunit [Lentzea albida]